MSCSMSSYTRRLRSRRYREIEQKANELIADYESEHGRIDGCVVKTELLLSKIDCGLEYFSDDERDEHGIPASAIGVLKAEHRMVLIHGDIRNLGRENQTIGEEIGHCVLHAKKDTATSEPLWMSYEASYFAACLQMPRDRFGPVAEKALVRALLGRPPQYIHWKPLAEKLNRLDAFVNNSVNKAAPGTEVVQRASHLLDTPVVEKALIDLEHVHGGQVSKNAQRRRFAELGFTVDLADIFETRFRRKDSPKFEQYLLADEIRLKAEDGTRAAGQ